MLTLSGAVKIGLKRLQCTFNLYYKGLIMDEKKSVAKCKGKVKKTTKIQNYEISGKELDFTFTLTIPKKGKIIFSASSIKSVVTTTTTTTTTKPTSTTTASMGKKNSGLITTT